MPLASVLVPTRNSARTIAACLESIRAQTYPEVEAIVVDNASTDATARVAQALADRVLDAGPERSAQRNAGAAAARGDYLFFVDSDMVLEPAVLADCVSRCETGAGAVVVPETSFGRGYWARCKALERSCYDGDETVEAARCFRRDVFEAAGGFDEELTGPEDWDLHERVRQSGVEIARAEARIHHDEGELALGPLLRKKYAYGRSLGAYREKHPELARRQLRVLRPAYVRHWRRLAAEPETAAGMAFMKACEIAAGAAGLASAHFGKGLREQPHGKPARSGPDG